jgi:hypothetical protein
MIANANMYLCNNFISVNSKIFVFLSKMHFKKKTNFLRIMAYFYKNGYKVRFYSRENFFSYRPYTQLTFLILYFLNTVLIVMILLAWIQKGVVACL